MDANTREIPREQWGAFLTQLQDRLKDRRVEVEIVGADVGEQALVRSARLRGISAVAKGSSAGAIEIDLGGDEGVDHRVLHPAHVYVIESASGEPEVLDIEDEDETKTLIRFT